jgi:outer membrane lipoprotein-sorting protein
MRLLTFLFALLTTISYGQDSKSQGILNKLSAKIKGHTSFYLEFSAYVKNTTNGTNTSQSGKGWVKGQKYYATYGENTVISNGLKTWTIIKDEKAVYESDANSSDDEMINPKKLMTIWETGFKNKYKKESKLNNQTVHIIDLYPKNPASVKYKYITLYIVKSNVELKKAILKTKDGTTMTYVLNKFTANPAVEDSKFVFDIKKYPGYKVIKD